MAEIFQPSGVEKYKCLNKNSSIFKKQFAFLGFLLPRIVLCCQYPALPELYYDIIVMCKIEILEIN